MMAGVALWVGLWGMESAKFEGRENGTAAASGHNGHKVAGIWGAGGNGGLRPGIFKGKVIELFAFLFAWSSLSNLLVLDFDDPFI